MIWFLVIVFVFALLMGFFQIPIWIMYGMLAAVLIFSLLRNPLISGKNPKKMIAYMKKSRAPMLQFLYYFLNGDLSKAEQAIHKIRSINSKRHAEAMLLMEQKQYEEAKEILAQMGGHKTKWYALSEIAIHEEDVEAFAQYKERLKDPFLLHMLDVDQAVYDGNRDKAALLLNNMIPKLRGYKLLTAVHYRNQILEGKL